MLYSMRFFSGYDRVQCIVPTVCEVVGFLFYEICAARVQQPVPPGADAVYGGRHRYINQEEEILWQFLQARA